MKLLLMACTRVHAPIRLSVFFSLLDNNVDCLTCSGQLPKEVAREFELNWSCATAQQQLLEDVVVGC